MSKDHKLISTPMSFSEGVSRTDSRTWGWLSILLAAAVVIVLAINFFWGGRPRPNYEAFSPAVEEPAAAEPRVIPVVPAPPPVTP